MPPERLSDAVERLRHIVATVLELDLAEVPADASFQQDLKLDSLEKVEVAVRIERAFGRGLADEEFAAVDSVLDAAGLLDAAGPLAPAPTGQEPPAPEEQDLMVTAGPSTAGQEPPAAASAPGTAPAAPASADRAAPRRAAAAPAGTGTGPAPGGTDLVRRLVGRHLAAGHGGRTAYVDPDAGEISYRDLYEAARGYAGALKALGVQPGTRALVVAQDSVATVVAFLGLWWHGCVPVPVSPLLGEDERDLIAADCAAGVLHLDTAPAGAPEGLVLLTGDEVRAGLRGGGPTTAHRPGLAEAPALHPADRAALIQYTSGSTGTPKGVQHSAAGIVAMLDGFGGRLGLRADDVVLSTARMPFGYGFGSSVLCSLDVGATTVLIGGAVDVRVVGAALRRHRPTVLCSVPRLYAALLDALRPGDEAVAGLRLCLTAGENCPADLYLRIQDTFGAAVVNCFGATELMHVVVATPPDRPMPGRMGMPVPGVTATVRDEHGRPVPDGTEGRLHIAGPSVSLGYLNRPDADRVTFADGGAYTGDLVRRDADGGLTHLCRVDDVLNLGGYKVAPAEIEAVVRDVDGVRDCAVVAARDDDGLECAVAFLVTDDADHDTVRRAVRSRIRTGLASYKRPARMEFVDALPTTTTGKVAAHRLREQAK
ncbi:AMP-binding protein [Streptomyces sp. NPDC005925]|uniref:AMP-binding protein n=1 Tax=Streptomyces sp. NPDC005925 TaxID=3157172 RepID=UPI0033C95EC4